MIKVVLKRVALAAVAILLFANWTTSCGSSLKNKIILDVPYHSQEHKNWCGVACIQMWDNYDHGPMYRSQQYIATQIGCGYGTQTVSQMLDGVVSFTGAIGHVAIESKSAPGAQGDLIGATVAGLRDYVPSIMPFFEHHGVLIIGYKWRNKDIKDEYGNVIDTRPIAVSLTYHDPRRGANLSGTIEDIRLVFVPSGSSYWVIVGSSGYVPDGIDGHNAFILNGGSYYGGPLNYNPKML